MNLIFLDIDGVMNNEIFFVERAKTRDRKLSITLAPSSRIDERCVDLLNMLCKDTGAKVVISSTWRTSGLDFVKKAFADKGGTFEIIGATPVLKNSACLRGNEIYWWIKENENMLGYMGHEFKTYVILDDDSDMLLWQKDHYFQVDPYAGLTPNICWRIKNFFKYTKNGEQLLTDPVPIPVREPR